jgi:CheY-like chemotaxis protein
MNILLIDDDEIEALMARRMLRKLNADATLKTFDYADEAIRYLRSAERPGVDVILCDINLPRMNGFEFADAFAALYPELREGVRLFLVTGSMDPQDRDRAERHPVIEGFFRKPIAPEAFAGLLEAA